VGLGDGAVEGRTLLGRNIELEGGGLALARGAGEGAGAPGAAAVDLVEVGELFCGKVRLYMELRGSDISLTKRLLVTQRNKDEAVVNKGRHGCNSGRLLATTESAGGDEHAGVLAPESTLLPLSTGLVPEGLELGGEVAVPSRDTKEDTVVRFDLGGVVEDGDVGGLGGRIHLGQDLLGERLGDPGG
jgi:hypothetical protein